MRRGLAVAGAVALAAALAGAGFASGSAHDRVVRAADAMEHLRGVRFSLEASSLATGAAPLGGDLALPYRGTGELAPPDRLRLRVTEPRPATLVILGESVRIDGAPASVASLRTLASPIALLEQLREEGRATFAGVGFTRGGLTARYRIDRGDRGVVEVELGLFDDRVRRQTFTIGQSADDDGSGLETVRTSYVIEYWDFDVPLDPGEPAAP